MASVNYRHTPEYTYPTQAQDAWDSLNWVFDNIEMLRGNPDKVAVGGSSAGGNLSAGIALREKDELGKCRIKGQLLAIPLCVGSDVFPYELIAPGKSSLETMEFAPILNKERLELFGSLLKVPDPKDRYYSPLLVPDEEVKGLPPAHFVICGMDPLRDDAFLYMEKLKRVG